MIHYKSIERQTIDLLDELGVKKIPIRVEEIARKKGLTISPYDLGGEISGVLVIQNDTGTIGYNPHESRVRQRFTIAHELGHYILHKNANNDLFIDREFQVLYRNQKSSQGNMKQEQEANAFAASLLMPERFLLNEIKQNSYNLTDDASLKNLAKQFNVSVAAMSLRLVNLNLFMRF
jgi:Zn-dependent peptidase ImmA (M78 family)